MSTKIFDCITFYNANFLFKTRFNILKDVVDYFVVCEADKDHVGNSKKYNFDEDFYNKNMNKIIYIQATDLPDMKIKGKDDIKILKSQMEKLFAGIKDAVDDDLIILSDEDEIPNPNTIKNFQSNNFKYGIFLQNLYIYKINVQNLQEGNGNWPGSRICLKKNLKSFYKFKLLKPKNLNYPFWRIDKEKSIDLIKNGGWHFSYLMTPEQISNKINIMAHTQLNKKEFKNQNEIKNKIKNLQDPFNRDYKLKKVEIDESYPDYIRKNIELYSNWIEK